MCAYKIRYGTYLTDGEICFRWNITTTIILTIEHTCYISTGRDTPVKHKAKPQTEFWFDLY